VRKVSGSTKPAQADLAIEGASSDLTLRQMFLDAATPNDDENARLRPLPSRALKLGDMRIKVDLPSYGITFLALEKRNQTGTACLATRVFAMRPQLVAQGWRGLCERPAAFRRASPHTRRLITGSPF
jgi:hypothetical protein